MRISKLFRGTDCRIFGDKKTNITGLSHNSKTVKAGEVYFALRDAAFVDEAVSNGAAAVAAASMPASAGVPCIAVPNVRRAMALAAKRFYGAADKMKLFGVVGTNGKTTTAHILRHILEYGTKRRAGLIGTTGVAGAGAEWDGTVTLTTPDPFDLHRILSQMYKNGIRTAVMEVSAHAIHYQKIAGLRWQSVVFTNITQDHLDFFPSFEEYKNTKVSFFSSADIRSAAVNADGEFGAEVLAALGDRARAVTYSAGNRDIVLSAAGSDFSFHGTRVHIPLCGRFNVYNALGAAAAAEMYGVKRERIAAALSTLPQVPGRFNTYTVNGAAVIIDYAHTPDGLKKILTVARELTADGGRLVSVFGCGGDRDRTKRGIMGQISVELADMTVITSDNPRTEVPDEIIGEIERGIITRNVSAVVDGILALTPQKYVKIADRTEAIEYALSNAAAGDVVVIAGKGHEEYMDINGEKIPYSDSQTVKNWQETHTTHTEGN